MNFFSLKMGFRVTHQTTSTTALVPNRADGYVFAGRDIIMEDLYPALRVRITGSLKIKQPLLSLPIQIRQFRLFSRGVLRRSCIRINELYYRNIRNREEYDHNRLIVSRIQKSGSGQRSVFNMGGCSCRS